MWNSPHVSFTATHQWEDNIGSGNGLVPSGNQPLPECHHTMSLGYDDDDYHDNDDDGWMIDDDDDDDDDHSSQNIRSKCVLSFLLPQQSGGCVDWQQWLQDSGAKLLQLAKVMDDNMTLKGRGDNVTLKDKLKDLQWDWIRQQQHRHLSTLSERKEKQLQCPRKTLTTCEDSADTQVQCILLWNRWLGSIVMIVLSYQPILHISVRAT